MKKKIIFVVIIMIVLVIGIYQKNQTEQLKSESIKIGITLPLTGSLSSYGVEYENGVRMAVKEINEMGGISGYPVELIIEDDMGDPKKTVTAVQKLLDVDGVNFLITALSSPSEAAFPLTQDKDVIHFALSVAKFGDRGENVFRFYWDMEKQGEAIGKAIKKEGVSRLGIIALNWADYVDFKKGLNDSLGTDFPIIEERYNFGDSDFRTRLSKIKSFDADGILVYGFPGQEVISITNQIAQLELDDKRLFSGATSFGYDFVYSQIGNILSRMMVIDSWYSLDLNNKKTEEFLNAYHKEYDQSLYGDAAYPYDVIMIIADAIKQVKNTNDLNQIRDKILKINKDGAVGSIKFDKAGNSILEVYLQEFIDGEWVRYDL